MGIIVSVVRNVLGGIIAFFDVISRGPKLKRSSDEQQQVDEQLQALSLYQFFACPFCIKTRRAMHKLNLPIATRSVAKGSVYRDELQREGGKVQTPCLRIEENHKVTWLYESSEIIAYLNERFAPNESRVSEA